MIPPVLLCSIAYIAGIAIADYCEVGTPLALGLLGFSCLIALFAILRRNSASIFVPAIVFLSLGMLIAALHIAHLKSGAIYRASAEPSFVIVEGRLITDPARKNDVLTFDLKAERVELSDPLDGRANWKVNELIRVRVRSERPLDLYTGKKIEVAGHLERPKSIGEFDYQRYLYRKGIMVIVTASADGVTITDKGQASLYAYAGFIRSWIKRIYSAHMPPDPAALLIGIVLGDDSAINDDLSESFRATGLTHILAASGMNIALVVAALWPLLRFFRLRVSVQYAILVAAAALYTLISGMSPSITRACLMATVALTAWLSGRDQNGLASISAAALILLIIDPFTLYDVGFQLSFLATASLLVFVPVLDRMMSDLPKWLRAGLSVTIAAQIGVLPILIYYFGQVSMISVLANLLIIPVAEPALILGIIVLPLQLIAPVFAKALYWLLSLEMSTVIRLTEIVAQAPGATLAVNQPSANGLVALFAFVCFTGLILIKFGPRLRLRFGHVVLLLIALSCASIWITAVRSLAPSQLQITFMDVGQGDSALLQAPDGASVLIDTGPDFDIIRQKFDLKGIKRIDAVMISHTHADHAAGVEEVFDKYEVGKFYYPESATRQAAMLAMLRSAREAGVVSVPVDNRDRIRFGKHLQMVVFCGQEGASGGGGEGSENEQSIVCLAKYKEFEALFTGDAEGELEHEICDRNRGGKLEADVLKVGHHGSATSSTKEFLKRVAPKVSVISVGEHNMYGHPSNITLARLRALGSKIYRTDFEGDIMVTSNGRSFQVSPQR